MLKPDFTRKGTDGPRRFRSLKKFGQAKNLCRFPTFAPRTVLIFLVPCGARYKLNHTAAPSCCDMGKMTFLPYGTSILLREQKVFVYESTPLKGER